MNNKNYKLLNSLDPNTHEFTLECLSILLGDSMRHDKEIKRIKFGNKVRMGLAIAAIYYLYDNLNQKIKELKNEKVEVIEEETTE